MQTQEMPEQKKAGNGAEVSVDAQGAPGVKEKDEVVAANEDHSKNEETTDAPSPVATTGNYAYYPGSAYQYPPYYWQQQPTSPPQGKGHEHKKGEEQNSSPPPLPPYPPPSHYYNAYPYYGYAPIPGNYYQPGPQGPPPMPPLPYYPYDPNVALQPPPLRGDNNRDGANMADENSKNNKGASKTAEAASPRAEDSTGGGAEAAGAAIGSGESGDGNASPVKTYVRANHPVKDPRREKKNAASRARSNKKRQEIEEIGEKPAEERTEEEQRALEDYETKRSQKNNRSRERAIERKEQINTILAKPAKKRSRVEKIFLEEAISRQQRKNEGDRLRRQRLKQLGLPTSGKTKVPGVKITARGPLPAELVPPEQPPGGQHYYGSPVQLPPPPPPPPQHYLPNMMMYNGAPWDGVGAAYYPPPRPTPPPPANNPASPAEEESQPSQSV